MIWILFRYVPLCALNEIVLCNDIGNCGKIRRREVRERLTPGSNTVHFNFKKCRFYRFYFFLYTFDSCFPRNRYGRACGGQPRGDREPLGTVLREVLSVCACVRACVSHAHMWGKGRIDVCATCACGGGGGLITHCLKLFLLF